MTSGGGSAASACVLCLYFAGLFLSAAATEGATHANTALVPRTTPHGRGILSKATSGLLLVGKIDGSISAVDEDSGKIMWTFDSGSPLISTSQDPASNVQVFPGIDGSIYVLHDNQSPKLELSRVTVSELVENSPSVTADGSAIRGALSTTLYYIDSVSGKLLRSVSDVEHSGVDSAAEDLDDAAILIARKDYKVQSFDRTLSSARWSISFAEIHYLDTTPVNAQNAVMEYVRGKQESLPCPSCGPSLTTGEDNSLHAKDPATGWSLWSVSFTSAPVVAFSLNNAGQSILQWDTYLSEGSSGVATDLWKTKGHSRNPRVLVGSVASGGLYALPLSSQSAHALAESEQGTNPGDKKLLELIESRDTDEADCLGSLKCVVLEVADTSEQNEPFPWLPEASKKTMLSETFDNRLFLLGAFVALAISGGAFAAFMRMRSRPEPLQPLQHIKKLRQSSGNEDDTEPTPSPCDGLVKLQEDKRSKMGRTVDAKSQLLKHMLLPPLKVHCAVTPQSPKQMNHQTIKTNQRNLTPRCVPDMMVMRPQMMEGTTNSHRQMNVMKRRLSTQDDVICWAPERDSSHLLFCGPDDERRILGRSLLNEVNDPSAFDHSDQRFGQPSTLCVGGCSSDPMTPEEAFDLTPTHGFNASPIHANWGTPRQYFDRCLVDSTSSNEYRTQHFYHCIYPGTSISSINALQSLSASTKASLTSWSNTGFENWGLMDVKGQVFTVGQLTFGPSVLGWGSDGTVVFDGEFHGRPVAVKRILKTFYDMAANEKDVLIISDEHPNLVRLFAVEEDQDFVFLALERCKMSLSEYIRSEEGQSTLTGPEGLPSAVCYQIARGVCEGLAALHSRGVVHRDLKPHNVLMSEHGRAKLSDMGLCRRMVPNQTSFFSNGPGGSSGWQAPEQLIIRDGRALRQTKAMDIFSLGCIMYHCISKGRHPFGECSYKRDDNILKSTPHLDAVDNCPEAMELISTMLEKDPQNRPTIEEVMEHPFWWNERQKLQFLIELSDRMENEDRQEDKTLIRSFESVAAKATGGNWGARLDPLLVTNLGQYRKYTFTSLRDLLRVVRNKHNHFRELPADLKTQMGPVPEGFYLYFAKRFPDLLMTTYSFAKEHLSSEPPMDKYFVNTLTRKSSNADSVSTPSSMPTIDEEMNTGLSSKKSNEDLTDLVDDEIERDGSPRLKVRTKPPNPVIRTVSGDSAVSGGSSARGTWDTVLNVIRENVDKNNAEQEGGLLRGQSLGSNYSPVRMTDQVTPKTGTEAGCVSSRTQPRSPNYHPRGFNSLINTERETRAEIESKKETDPYRELQSPIKLSSGCKKYEVPNRPIVGWEEDPDNENYTLLPFPQRPGAPVCDFYQKTGFCKYHERCRYHHPPENAVRLNEDGLPIRTGESICDFYKNTHNCKFGGACKFNHPNMKPIYAGSVGNHSNSQRSPY